MKVFYIKATAASAAPYDVFVTHDGVTTAQALTLAGLTAPATVTEITTALPASGGIYKYDPTKTGSARWILQSKSEGDSFIKTENIANKAITAAKLADGLSTKGDKGDTGATGPAGPRGAQGPKGDKGDAGSAASVKVDNSSIAKAADGTLSVKDKGIIESKLSDALKAKLGQELEYISLTKSDFGSSGGDGDYYNGAALKTDGTIYVFEPKTGETAKRNNYILDNNFGAPDKGSVIALYSRTTNGGRLWIKNPFNIKMGLNQFILFGYDGTNWNIIYNSADLPDDTVVERNLTVASVTEPKLGAGSVDKSKLDYDVFKADDIVHIQRAPHSSEMDLSFDINTSRELTIAYDHTGGSSSSITADVSANFTGPFEVGKDYKPTSKSGSSWWVGRGWTLEIISSTRIKITLSGLGVSNGAYWQFTYKKQLLDETTVTCNTNKRVEVKDLGITTDKIANKAITAAKLADGVTKGPKGDTGARGPQGPTGARGPTGATGPAGARGATGAQGPKGDKGDTGAQGPKGDKGDAAAGGSSFPIYDVFRVNPDSSKTPAYTRIQNHKTHVMKTFDPWNFRVPTTVAAGDQFVMRIMYSHGDVNVLSSDGSKTILTLNSSNQGEDHLFTYDGTNWSTTIILKTTAIPLFDSYKYYS